MILFTPRPGSYTPDFTAVKKRPIKTPQWRAPAAQAAGLGPDGEGDGHDASTPGPGAYEANYSAVRERITSDVRIMPEVLQSKPAERPLPGPGVSAIVEGVLAKVFDVWVR